MENYLQEFALDYVVRAIDKGLIDCSICPLREKCAEEAEKNWLADNEFAHEGCTGYLKRVFGLI